MELIIDLPDRFRRFEREDFIALFPRRLPTRCYRPRVAAVNRVVVNLSKPAPTAHRAMIAGFAAGIDGALLFILKKLD